MHHRQAIISGLSRARLRAMGDLWIIDELAHHGYNLSSGILYKIFHSLEQQSLFKSKGKLVNRKSASIIKRHKKARWSCRAQKARFKRWLMPGSSRMIRRRNAKERIEYAEI